jgi:2-methylisocitrate lyase-like PEP mutase family enzyme
MTTRKDSRQSTVSGEDEIRAEQKRKAETFRNLHIRGNPIVLFNAWDAGSAKAVAEGGAKAIATSSWSVAAANGFVDGERIPLDLAINNLRRVASAVEVPVTVDLESGYGDAPNAVGMIVRMAIEVCAAGCNLEDSFPANGELRKPCDQVDRIACARQVADEANTRFFINARQMCSSRDPQSTTTIRCWKRRSSEHDCMRKPVRTDSLLLALWISI